MNMIPTWAIAFLASAGFAVITATPAGAATPNIIHYQGLVRSGADTVNGPAQFKFAILRDGTTWWRNAPDANADGEPDAAVTRTVTNGVFHVPLGDTSLANMAALTFFDPADPNNASASTAPIRLRIWFNDGVNGFEQLSPEQPLSSAPFALWAANVAGGAITGNQLANGAVTSAKLAANSVNSTHIVSGSIVAADLAAGVRSGLDASDGSPGNVVRVGAAGLVQVGTQPTSSAALVHPPESSLTLWASPSALGILAPTDPFGASRIASGAASGGFLGAFDGASGLAVSGTTAFVVARDENAFTAINNTDPTAPVIIGMLTNGVGVTSLDKPEAIAVSGNFAYVVSRGTAQSLTVINVSNPGQPAVTAVRSDGAGGFNDLQNPSDVAVSANGNTVFVAAESDDAVSIINVTTKTSPTLTSVLKDGVGSVTTLNAPRQLIVSGSRLYVQSSEAITIFNIASLAAPTVLATIPGIRQSMALSGTTLFTSSSLELEVWDVSGTTPVRQRIAGLKDIGTSGDYGFGRMTVEGTNLWAVTQRSPERVLILDITTPSAPVLTHLTAAASLGGFINEPFLTSPRAIAATGEGNAIVLNASPGAFVNLRKSSTSAFRPSLVTEGDVGIRVTKPMASLHVNGSTLIEQGNLTVGTGGHTGFGNGSLVVGRDNVNRTDNSGAVGLGLIVGANDSSTSAEFSVGQFNVPSSVASPIRFSVGNGIAGARTNALTITTRGRMGLDGVSNPTHSIQHASGAHLTVGGSWVNASDRNLKENIRAAQPAEILDKVASLPIYTWNYKAESATNQHLGPMAQDFHAAFGLGDDDRTIATVDASGVALAAIRALREENRLLRERLEALERKMAGPSERVPPSR